MKTMNLTATELPALRCWSRNEIKQLLDKAVTNKSRVATGWRYGCQLTIRTNQTWGLPILIKAGGHEFYVLVDGKTLDETADEIYREVYEERLPQRSGWTKERLKAAIEKVMGLEVVGEESAHGTVLRLRTPTGVILSILIGISDYDDGNGWRITSIGQELEFDQPLWALNETNAVL